uniref:Uncharacterized protein n=1 Tax=Castor canadensis TaxID=51338 RepID=A0A8C0W0P2_CASCN
MKLIPTHHFRDIERKPEYLQPEKFVPPPYPGPAGTMWFIRDGYGIACAIVNWFLVLYAEFVVLFVMLIPSRDYVYSIINRTVFNLLAFLALHCHPICSHECLERKAKQLLLKLFLCLK